MLNPGDPQSLNRYAYVRNNPLKYTDPTGHALWAGDSGDNWDILFVPERGDILLENLGTIIPGEWDHAILIANVDPDDESRMWVVEAVRGQGVWHHSLNLDTYSVDNWVILRVDVSSRDRQGAAQWAERLAGWQGNTERVDTSGAPFVSMIPFNDSPWGWLDIGVGEEGYYCFEVIVDAYLSQDVDITGRTQRLEYHAGLLYPEKGQVMASIALSNALTPYLGMEIFNSPYTIVIRRKEQ